MTAVFLSRSVQQVWDFQKVVEVNILNATGVSCLSLAGRPQRNEK